MDVVKAELRNPTDKAKQLRRSGRVPCVIDGAGMKESISICIDQDAARKLKRSKRNGSKADIQVGTATYHTLIKNLEYNVVNNEIVHISFHILDASKKANSVADIVLLNRDKVQGILEQIQMRVPHSALPEDLIDTVTIDLEALPIGTVLAIGDIPEFQSDKIELQADPGNIVLRISDKKRAAELPTQEDAEPTV